MRWQLAVAPGAPPCGALVLFPLDVAPAERDALHALLPEPERARAARFLSPQHASRFIVAHARLRQLLAPLVQVAPDQIRFDAAAHGKPHLADAAAASGLQFNLSHSDGWGLVGWAHRRHIGVDVEVWRAMRDERALVHRYFAPAEIAAYEALPDAARAEGFFNGWTRKEAYIKAVGRGLGLPLDSFDVSLDRCDARLLRASTYGDDTRCWSLAAPQGPPRTSLAVVLESHNVVVLPDLP